MLSQFRRLSPNSSHNYQNNLYASAFPPQQSWLNKHKHALRYKILIHRKRKKVKNNRILNVRFHVEKWEGRKNVDSLSFFLLTLLFKQNIYDSE